MSDTRIQDMIQANNEEIAELMESIFFSRTSPRYQYLKDQNETLMGLLAEEVKAERQADRQKAKEEGQELAVEAIFLALAGIGHGLGFMAKLANEKVPKKSKSKKA